MQLSPCFLHHFTLSTLCTKFITVRFLILAVTATQFYSNPSNPIHCITYESQSKLHLGGFYQLDRTKRINPFRSAVTDEIGATLCIK